MRRARIIDQLFLNRLESTSNPSGSPVFTEVSNEQARADGLFPRLWKSVLIVRTEDLDSPEFSLAM
jgi:hypothetical protein